MNSLALDIRYDPSMDICSAEGFISAVHAATRLKPGAGLLAAPVCSSWVFMILVEKR